MQSGVLDARRFMTRAPRRTWFTRRNFSRRYTLTRPKWRRHGPRYINARNSVRSRGNNTAPTPIYRNRVVCRGRRAFNYPEPLPASSRLGAMQLHSGELSPRRQSLILWQFRFYDNRALNRTASSENDADRRNSLTFHSRFPPSIPAFDFHTRFPSDSNNSRFPSSRNRRRGRYLN